MPPKFTKELPLPINVGGVSPQSPSWRGIPLKYISLGVLVVQNSSLVLVLRYSRTLPGEPYLTSTAVLLCEVVKLLVSTLVYWYGELDMEYKQSGEYRKLSKSPLYTPIKSDSTPLPLESSKLTGDSMYATESRVHNRSPQGNNREARLGLERAMDSGIAKDEPLETAAQRTLGKCKLLLKDVSGRPADAAKMAVPAILYFIQNNLQYLAATYLDAATFQVTYQMKILTTALLSVLILKVSLSSQKWISLFILTMGIILVQTPSGTTTVPEPAVAPELLANNSTLAAWEKNATANRPSKSLRLAVRAAETLAQAVNASEKVPTHLAGFVAVGIACVLSGFAGVYFEKVLKNANSAVKTSLWVRNIQLGVFSIVPGLIFGVILYDGQQIMEKGFFQGYNFWTWVCILMQAAGGIVVALVVKYANNILKGFATSISIIGSSLASVYLFNFVLTVNFMLGCAMVIYATFLYGGTNLLTVCSAHAKK